MGMTWTDAELSEFNRLVDDSAQPNREQRINARDALREFMNLHGREKCNAMWDYLESAPRKLKR